MAHRTARGGEKRGRVREGRTGQAGSQAGAGRTSRPQFGAQGSGFSVTLEAEADPLEMMRWSTGLIDQKREPPLWLKVASQP